jgi:sulfite reductase (NADPH) flavoprotein alpha-component
MTAALLLILGCLGLLLLGHLGAVGYLLWQHHLQSHTAQHLDYLIVYASQSGHAQDYAQQTALQLTQHELQVAVCNIAQLQLQHLRSQSTILWVLSTYGEGDAPDSAQDFVQQLMPQRLDLSQLSFAILALGDRHFQHFCRFGQQVAAWLYQQQAKPLFATILLDQSNPKQLQQWFAQLLPPHGSKTASPLPNSQPWQRVQLVGRQLLNAGSQGGAIYQILLQPTQSMHWQAGDILEVQCENTAEDLQAFAQHQGIAEDWIAALKHLNLQQAPARLASQSMAAWLVQLTALPCRNYSIASLPEQQLIELVIRQKHTATGLGLGSGWLTTGLRLQQYLEVRIQSHPHFHLPTKALPLILIGNGTGIAGLKAHLSQRAIWNHSPNWLIFGERQRQFDLLYAQQIATWQQQGVLTRVDYAFSRDAQHKRYVQDVLLEQAGLLQDWLQRGAAIYVCGRLQGMASEVDQALEHLLGAHGLAQLKQAQRYQRDVY